MTDYCTRTIYSIAIGCTEWQVSDKSIIYGSLLLYSIEPILQTKQSSNYFVVFFSSESVLSLLWWLLQAVLQLHQQKNYWVKKVLKTPHFFETLPSGGFQNQDQVLQNLNIWIEAWTCPEGLPILKTKHVNPYFRKYCQPCATIEISQGCSTQRLTT